MELPLPNKRSNSNSIKDFLYSNNETKETKENISKGRLEFLNKYQDSFLKNFKEENKDNVIVEIEIIYKEDDMLSNEYLYQSTNQISLNEKLNKTENNFTSNNKLTDQLNNTFKTNLNFFNSSRNFFGDQIESESPIISLPMEIHKHSTILSFPKNKTVGTFIENELQKTGDPSKNYVKIELRVKRNKINMETMLNCFEYFLNKNFDFQFDKENLISYFHAFSICKMHDKRKEVLDRLLLELTDDNILYFVKVVSNSNDEFLNSYCFWLLRHLANKNEKLDEIIYNGYNFDSIVKLNQGQISFDKNNKVIYTNKKLNLNLSANLNFLKGYFTKFYETECEKYYTANNYFNIGKILRRKSDEKLINDYPHYYQMVLENDPGLMFYAIRPSENSSFILSRSIVRTRLKTILY